MELAARSTPGRLGSTGCSRFDVRRGHTSGGSRFAHLYVAQGGNNTSNNCQKSSTPCSTVTYALGLAGSGATIEVTGTISDSITINQPVTISGAAAPAANPAEINAPHPQESVIVVNSKGTVNLADLTLENGSGNLDGDVFLGGGIEVKSAATATVNVTGSNISDNRGDLGGGIYNHQATVNIIDSTVSGNTAGQGSGIDNVGTMNINDSTISGNIADDGSAGGILNYGTLNVTDSTVSGNTVTAHENQDALGGGIENIGTVNLTDSTVSGNTVTAPDQYDAVGGGIFTDSGRINITNSTISGNSAGEGGGIFTYGIANFLESTISGNSALTGEGGGILNSSGTVKVTDSILATIGGPASGSECVGPLSDGGNNVTDDTSCGFASSEVNAKSERLKSLAYNGGPTQTMALTSGNPAIRSVPSGCSATDQRGAIRPSSNCDAGAYQSNGVFPTSFMVTDFLTTTKNATTAVLGETGLPPAAIGTVLFETESGIACILQLTGRPGEATTCLADFGQNVPFVITGFFDDTDGMYLSSKSTNEVNPHQ